MKKLLLFIILVLVFPIFGCDDSSNKNEINPALLLLFGGNSLMVSVTYNGAGGVYATTPGTQYLYVYLYKSDPGLGAGTQSYMHTYMGKSIAPVTSTPTTQTIAITGIASGDYYVLAFYDWRGGTGSEPDNQGERYLLYNNLLGTNCVADATTINIPTVTSISMTFGDSYTLDAGGGTGGGPKFKTSCLP